MNQENVEHKLDSLSTKGMESEFFAPLLAEVTGIYHSLGITDEPRITDNFERLWLPLALNLAQGSNALDRTLIQGVLGGQGTGKSTLCIVLKLILNHLGFSVAALSIDDLYLTYGARQALQEQDPRLIWRGPPGTHDVKLGLEVIELCLQTNNLDNTPDNTVDIALPRFDKSLHNGAGDRINPEVIPQPDILLFEGWFVGVKPIAERFFANPPAPIITPEDQQFAVDCNRRLGSYVPLWTKLDSLVVIDPEDYRLSQQWRKEAEHKMIARGKTGMSDEEIEHFVEYFWKALHPKLFIEPLTKTADLVVEIRSDHSLGQIYSNT